MMKKKINFNYENGFFLILQEINRVLRKGGRYICISLLQEHILRKLISYFPSSDFMFRVIRCDVENKTLEEDGNTFPVFFVLATKFPGLAQQVNSFTSNNYL